MEKLNLCPCHSQKPYENCCGPFHNGTTLAPSAELLMRSRYGAYPLRLYEYLLKTTHPDNPLYPIDIPLWTKEIKDFTEKTLFVNLTIHDVQIEGERSLITFTADLREGGKEVGFTEQSLFEKVKGYWLYKDGIYLD